MRKLLAWLHILVLGALVASSGIHDHAGEELCRDHSDSHAADSAALSGFQPEAYAFCSACHLICQKILVDIIQESTSDILAFESPLSCYYIGNSTKRPFHGIYLRGPPHDLTVDFYRS